MAKEKTEFEKGLVTCNKCKHLNFALKQCKKDRKNPIKLNTYTNSDGFIHVLTPSFCEVKNG